MCQTDTDKVQADSLVNLFGFVTTLADAETKSVAVKEDATWGCLALHCYSLRVYKSFVVVFFYQFDDLKTAFSK